MSGSMLGFLIEGVVVLLLLTTIGYCVLLNRRLKRLRADEEALRQTIAELVKATDLAERAIGGLKETARACEKDLSQKLTQAERYSRSMDVQIENGEKVLTRLARVSSVARTHGLVEREGSGEGSATGEQTAGRAA